MHWIDWLILTLPLMICAVIAFKTRSYVRNVSDFLAAGRSAGRYLICTARSEQGAGAVVYVATFQGFLVSGFTLSWWQQLSVPAALLLTVTGYVIYRYRETRALTIGEFFELRYSRRFRLFTGVLGLIAGLLNFGIIPAVGARFMVTFLGLPQTVDLSNLVGVPAQIQTYLLLMGVFLTVCVVMTTMAGQISILVTDCAEGMLSQLFYVAISLVLLVGVFDWSTTRHALLDTQPQHSLVNPFDAFGTQDFNIWYVLIGIFFLFYRTIAWQNQHAFNSSAATPHESRMGGILGRWRGFAGGAMVTVLSLCAMTFFRTHPTEIDAALNQFKDPATRDQMRAPIALSMMLPVGTKGALLSICLMGIIAGDGIHLHSWGSIFIQDVVMPLRRRPLTSDQHVRLLRLSVVGVALWAFLFGWLFPQTKYVAFWWAITEAIFVSGAGITLIGGLYWSGGTAAGAWTAMLIGGSTAFIGLGGQFYCEQVLKTRLFLTLPQIAFVAAIAAASSYVVCSYFTCRQPHDMDKLLHRGLHAVADEQSKSEETAIPNWWNRIFTFGIDRNFTRSDRWITIGITVWSMAWFGIFGVGTVVSCVWPLSNAAWAEYWLWTAVYLPIAVGIVTTVWFTWGGARDLSAFFSSLNAEGLAHPQETAGDIPLAGILAEHEMPIAAVMQFVPGEPSDLSAR